MGKRTHHKQNCIINNYKKINRERAARTVGCLYSQSLDVVSDGSGYEMWANDMHAVVTHHQVMFDH